MQARHQNEPVLRRGIGRNDASYEQRVLLDECYGREWTFVLDAQILLRTLPAVFKAKGSY
jgi:exopolysaccharide production protein ExoY